MQELERKLEDADVELINNLMMKEMKCKWMSLSEAWCEALQGVDTRRKVPQDYNTAIQEPYGVSQLQVYT